MSKRLIDANELRLKLEKAIEETHDVRLGAGLLRAIDKMDEQPTVKTEMTHAMSSIDAILLDEHPDYVNSVMRELARMVGMQLMGDNLLTFRREEDPYNRLTRIMASVRVLVPVPEELDEWGGR